jgi:lipopolysaccharide transport system permease protein
MPEMSDSLMQYAVASDTTAAEPVVVREHRPTIREMVSRTWAYRGLFMRLGLRRVVKGFAGTRLGRPWLVIRPLITIFGMALIFGSVLRAPSNGVPYLLYLLIAMLGWTVIERTVFWCTRSIDTYYKIVGLLDLPVLLAPFASVAIVLLDFCVMAGIAVGVTTYYTVSEGAPPLQLGPSTLIAVAGLALGLALGFGVGLWLAALNGLARDVRLLLPFALRIWMFVTPVIYAVDALPDRWRALATINPAAAPVEMVKEGLLGIGTITATQLAISVGATAAFMVSGLWFLTRLSPTLLRVAPMVDDEDEERV